MPDRQLGYATVPFRTSSWTYEVRLMSLRRWLLLSGSLLLSGCLYHARERTDQTVCNLAAQPYDLAPVAKDAPKTAGEASKAKQAREAVEKSPAILPTDVETSKLMQELPASAMPSTAAVQQVAFAQAPDQKVEDIKKKFDIPKEIPGRDAPAVPSGPWANPQEKLQDLRRFYAELPSLPEAPKALPSPNGRPYTLADLQQIAA